MTILDACLGTEQQTWEYMQKLVEGENWEAVYLISQSQNFKCKKEINFVPSDTKVPLPDLALQIRQSLNGKIIDTVVALNLALGSGKEHMAILSALIKLGLGIRLVAYTSEGVREI